MDIKYRALKADMLDEYLNFFDNAAFADHPDWSQCYCMHFHWQSKWDDESPRSNRDRVIEHINGGVIQGYSAYLDGKVIGWCNANGAIVLCENI